jgi:dTDP-4-amino-4,6-dideoxygalactose transaminase
VAGDAGMLVTSDDILAQRAQHLRNYGQSVRYHHPEMSLNRRLDEIHAAMLADQLIWLPEFTARRRQIAGLYRSGATNPLVRQAEPPKEASEHVHHLYVIACAHRDRLIAHLAACGVQSVVHYPIPVDRQKTYLGPRRDPAGLPAGKAHADAVLAIPRHPLMTDSDVQRVTLAVNSFKAA